MRPRSVVLVSGWGRLRAGWGQFECPVIAPRRSNSAHLHRPRGGTTSWPIGAQTPHRAADGAHETCSRPPAAPTSSPMFELALPFRQGVRLNQQTLSFIAAPCLAEAYHHGVPCAFRLDPAREQRLPCRQEFKIVE